MTWSQGVMRIQGEWQMLISILICIMFDIEGIIPARLRSHLLHA